MKTNKKSVLRNFNKKLNSNCLFLASLIKDRDINPGLAGKNKIFSPHLGRRERGTICSIGFFVQSILVDCYIHCRES